MSYQRDDIDNEVIVRLYLDAGWPKARIARHFRVALGTIRRRLIDMGVANEPTPRSKRDPTPAEIAEGCREIQATWSAEERSRRDMSARQPEGMRIFTVRVRRGVSGA